jgi:hypothetical protein
VRRAAVLAAALLGVLACPAPAHACWDGHLGTAPRASLCVMTGPTRWKAVVARELADWLVRVEALVPPGYHASACEGGVSICEQQSPYRCLGHAQMERDTYWGFFRAVQEVVEARPAAVHAALQKKATPLTVQVAVGYDEAGARALARRLSRLRPADQGFYEAGAFPGGNDKDVVHVLADRDDEGAPIYRVVVGAYLTRAEARATVARLREIGLRGFVRPL